jgi:hypothetical protein
MAAKRKSVECEICEGYGVRLLDNKEIPCGPCTGSGKVTTWVNEPDAMVPAKKPAPTPTPTHDTSDNVHTLSVVPTPTPVFQTASPLPDAAPIALVFHAPGQYVEVKVMASVPNGDVWVLDANGAITKLGVKK